MTSPEVREADLGVLGQQPEDGGLPADEVGVEDGLVVPRGDDVLGRDPQPDLGVVAVVRLRGCFRKVSARPFSQFGKRKKFSTCPLMVMKRPRLFLISKSRLRATSCSLNLW